MNQNTFVKHVKHVFWFKFNYIIRPHQEWKNKRFEPQILQRVRRKKENGMIMLVTYSNWNDQIARETYPLGKRSISCL